MDKKNRRKVWNIKIKFYLCTALEKKVLHTQGESVAQQVEHIPFKDGVLGSNPS